MKPVEIVVVEDDVNILEIIRLYLERESFVVYTSRNASEGLFLIETVVPDIVLLDINLPDQNGFDLARKFRKISDGILFFITGEKSKEKIIHGFEVGCDDYITKPFDPSEVVARVKANLRRLGKREEVEIIRFGDITINMKEASVYKNGQLLDLSKKEKMILFYLVKHPNQVISTETLYDKIWGYDSISDLKTVSVHISTLRKKIEDEPNRSKFIETVRGFGYKFKIDS